MILLYVKVYASWLLLRAVHCPLQLKFRPRVRNGRGLELGDACSCAQAGFSIHGIHHNPELSDPQYNYAVFCRDIKLCRTLCAPARSFISKG